MGTSTPPPPIATPPPPPPAAAARPRPPLPASSALLARAQQAAKAAWMAPLVVIIFNFVLKNVGPSDGFARTMVVAAVSLLLYIGGLALAVYALFQVRTVGKPGVLAPALVGLLLNGLFLALILFVAVASFNAARARRQGQAVLPSSAAAVSSTAA